MERQMKYIYNFFNCFLDVLGTSLFIAFCLIVMLQVFSRYVLNNSPVWTEEIARYLLVITTFLGAAIATRERSNLVAIDLFTNSSDSFKLFVRIFVDVIIITLFSFLFKSSFDLVEIGKAETTSSMLWLKMSHVYLILPISFILIVLYSLINLIGTIKGRHS